MDTDAMKHALILVGWWGGAWLSLLVALGLTKATFAVLGGEVETDSRKKELILAAIAASIEAVPLWAITCYVPLIAQGRALRAMLLPLVITGLLYRVAHLESWERFEAIALIYSTRPQLC